MRRLSRRAALLAEIAVAYLRVAMARRGRDLPGTLKQLRSHVVPLQSEPSPAQLLEALRVGRATDRALRILPVDARCLTSSLVVSRLLARRNIPGRLVIGVLPGESFTAHAWVEVGSQPVLHPGDGNLERLTEL